jgi:hypothetical protein
MKLWMKSLFFKMEIRLNILKLLSMMMITGSQMRISFVNLKTQEMEII